MFDRTVNAKFKTSAANAGPGQNPGRRNSMLTPAKGASVGGTGGNIRKLTKVNSLTRDYAMCYGPNIYQNSNNAGSNASTLQRTTSESLRLNSLKSVTRASSNTSLPTPTAMSTSTSLAPKSSSSSGSDSNATPQQQQQQPASGNSRSRGSSGDKASSPNNNGARAVGGAAAVAGPAVGIGTASHHHQPHHHHHHHHHHQHHHHQQQHPHQTSLSQGHASLTVAGITSGASGSGSSGGSGAGTTTRKPKTTSSFEITSVTVGHPKLNAAGDTGDESADDLDESHTDDNSRITDLENETPSMSEDTFSKEEVYYANNALSTNAPVIPTSSQYGLVVVDPIGPSLGQTIQNVQVNVSDNIINVVSAAVTPGGTKKKDDIKETQHRSERFKVVKIESTEPFKRGRWMCMDYLDHSSVGSGNNNEKTGSSSEATTDGVGGSDAPPQKTTQSMILPPTQKLNENHLEANSTDANWNYAEQQSQQQQSSQQQHQQHSQQQQQSSHQQQQPQMSATPSGVMTAPATVVHGMHQLHMEAQQQQQQQLFDSVNANASSTNPQSVDTGNMGYALTAAMQLQQTLQQLKQREEAMESGYQNGGDVAAPNNNNSGGGGGGGPPATATTESQLSTSYVEQQQPLSPVPQTPQITPTFAAVAAGQAAPNFQLEQQQQPQATSQIDGILPQSFPQQQHQQQQTPQQSTPQQQAPPVAAAVTAASAGATTAAAPATQQQTSNTSNAAVTTGQGQTLPLLSHMTSYEQQPSVAGAGASAPGTGTAASTAAVAPPAIPTLHLQSAPATIADPQQLMVPQQQQDEHQQQQQQQIPPTNIASASANNSNLNLTNPNVVANAEPTKNALTLTDEQVNAATTATGAAAKAAPGATSTTSAMQLQQLQQQPNAESETESFTTSAISGGIRKRAFSNPHIGIIGGGGGGGGLSVDPSAFMHRLNPQLYYYNKSQSGRSSFCVDESLWPTNPNHNARASDTNLYMGSSTEEDNEEAIDQFSPTLYTRSAKAASRAIPIPTSAGNSPQHQLHPQLNQQQARIATGINSTAAAAAAAAFSASPSIYAYPHSPFYASSPETSSLSSPVQISGMQGHPGHSSRISFSYDPAFQRLQVPKPRSPLECASVFAAVAAAATCGGGGGGDPHQMGMATPSNSASGTSAVAIDNKIEQAMDLVKSHLMIAVREEVEVLKERISELMDKISKLEVENSILKSNIPPETLQQIQMQLQIAGSQQPAAVAAPPATPAIQAPPTSAPTAAGQAAAAVAAAAAGAVSAVVVGNTGAPVVATSPASTAAPTSIPNGSAENGSVSGVSSGNNSDASVVEQVTAAAVAAGAVPTVNGPMS
ncbi:hypothetical protein KR059_006303 [Drosophila kikkawai]|nr:hypothetical protein KR059_006303 [Drosophila kikkawai]